jgi:hypothetical protein
MALVVPRVAHAQARQADVVTLADLPPEAVRQIQAVWAIKARRTAVQQKIGSQLLQEQQRRRGVTIAGVPSLRRALNVADDGLVVVDIRAEVTPGVLARIAAVGGEVVNAHPDYRAIRARLPVDDVDAVAELSEVQFIAPADQMMTSQRRTEDYGSPDVVAQKVNTSEGYVAHRVAWVRLYYGVTGAGVGVGVLSNGIDSLAARQASGDLPAVTVLSGQAGSGDKGTAMLEIVHDLAPGATLYFATATGSQAQFAANIQALCAAGAKIIVDDTSYVGESVFQDSVVAQGVNAAAANGCFYFSAAGNAGNKSDGTSGVWEGDFLATASNPVPTGGTAHNFGGANSTQILQDSQLPFTLQWSDPRGASNNDYDLFLFNPALNSLILYSDNPQTGSQDPFESIDSTQFGDVNNRLVIARFFGSARYLHLNTNGGRLSISTTGQMWGHAAAKNGFGVGAVNVATAGGGIFTAGPVNPVQTTSSDGPRRIFYQPNGIAITPGNLLATGGELVQKPDFAAADCVATSTPGLSPFCGTSAAAPHAAAIAALMLETAPTLNLAQMRAAFAARALDIESPGVDPSSGAGIIDAVGAVGRVHPAFTDPALVPGSTTVKAVHIAQLRSRVSALRFRCGLADPSYTPASLTSGATLVSAVQITELRTALNGAYTACGVALPTYTDPALAAGTAIKAAHINELRAAVIALE